MLKLPVYITAILIACFAVCCSNTTSDNLQKPDSITTDPPDIFYVEEVQRSVAELYFDSLLCSGFDFPVGNEDGKGSYTSKLNGKKYDSWYIATTFAEEYSLGIHTGEDWNGTGGGDTDLGQDVYAIAQGVVINAEKHYSPWGNIVMIRHLYLENGKIDTCFSQYAHLDSIAVLVGDTVMRRQKIGTIGTADGAYPAHLHFEIRKNSLHDYPPDYWPSSHTDSKEWVIENYYHCTDFINNHRRLTIPANLPDLLLAVKQDYKLYHFRYGKLVKDYEIALSQEPEGHKQYEGDNRLPEGEYRIVQIAENPSGGAMSAYFESGWMRISYPNAFDAKNAYNDGRISKTERDAIIRATKAQNEPPKNTAIGGGIGIHGWAGDWSNHGNRNLTWGCISMHNYDIEEFIGEVPLNTIIIIAK